jgi:hypothetical protein
MLSAHWRIIVIKKNESLFVKIIFTALLLFLILQHHYIFMYYDDYGHASISYGHVVSGVKGTELTLKGLLEWINWYYFEWGGRVVYYFIFLVPLLSISISMFMFIQSIILFFIFVYMFKIIQSFNENFNPIVTILSLIVLYGLIPLELLKESVFWASASVCYIWSLLPLTMGIYYLMRVTRIDAHIKTKEMFITPLLFFFAASSFEQSGAATLIFIFVYILYLAIVHKKLYLRLTLPTFVLSLCGVLIQYLSPGNIKRISIMHSDFRSLSLLEKINSGIPSVINFIFDPRTSIFIVILSLLSISTLGMIVNEDNKYKYLLAFPLVFSVYYLIKSYFNFGISINMEILIILIIFFYFMLFFYQKKEYIPILFTAAAAIFCLILSPVLQVRSLVFFLIFLFIPINIVINSVYITINGKYKPQIIIVFVVFMAFSFNNYKNNYYGYKENYTYAISNHKKLISISKEKKSTGWIELYKYPNDIYREHLPYDPTTPYEPWILQYYDLPEGTHIEWVDPKM